LRAQFHEDACALSTVQFWITELRRGREDLHDEPRTGRPSAENLSTKIQELLDDNPLESARLMVEILQVSHSMVLQHLHENLQFQSFCLGWVYHLLTSELREQQHVYAREMVPILAAAAHDRSHHLVTRDESLRVFSDQCEVQLSRNKTAGLLSHPGSSRLAAPVGMNISFIY
jgi:hypothetical protein